MPRMTIDRRAVLDSDRQKIGARLREARTKAGLTQRQAAMAARISDPCLVYYEHGRRSPSISTLIRLCKAYGISIDGLVEGLEL